MGDVKGSRTCLKWTTAMSQVVLKTMCGLVHSGSKTDKGFKDAHLNQCARALQETLDMTVTAQQVSNHLRKWRARWQSIEKLKRLSGALWVEDSFTISVSPEHYTGIAKDHPKDAELLNKTLEFYEEMRILFCGTLATGVFAKGITEPIGEPIESGEYSTSRDAVQIDTAHPGILGGGPAESTAAESSVRRTEPVGSKSSGKRRKKDDDDGVVSHLLGGLTEVAQALTLASANTVPAGLFTKVMDTPDFEENDLVRVYDYLVLHKLEALGFLGKPTKHRQRWIREQFGYT